MPSHEDPCDGPARMSPAESRRSRRRIPKWIDGLAELTQVGCVCRKGCGDPDSAVSHDSPGSDRPNAQKGDLPVLAEEAELAKEVPVWDVPGEERHPAVVGLAQRRGKRIRECELAKGGRCRQQDRGTLAIMRRGRAGPLFARTTSVISAVSWSVPSRHCASPIYNRGRGRRIGRFRVAAIHHMPLMGS